MTDTTHINSAAEDQVLVDAVMASTSPAEINPEVLYSLVVPEGAMVEYIDFESHLPEPRRKRGSVALHDSASFIKLVKEHEWAPTHVYSDWRSARMVAVLNDAGGEFGAGWGDHRFTLTLRHTPEWEYWMKHHGKMLSQTDFAEHIEDGLLEIIEPVAAEMLELAQTFHAHSTAAFKSSTILSSGQRQLVYEETTTAAAGHLANITVPSEFTLGIAPYEGLPAYRIKARFRHRTAGGQLALGYILDRPQDVLKLAFADVTEDVGREIDSPILNGTPPEDVGR